jgi:hypothetical protein
MPVSPSPSTLRQTWASTVKDLLTAKRSSEEQALAASIALVEAAVPPFRLATLDHVARSKRIAAAAIVARCRRDSAPAEDPAKLRALLQRHPTHFEATLAGLHRLHARAADPAFAWNLNPPSRSDLTVLKSMATEETEQLHIRAELAAVNYNPVSALAVAYLDLAEMRPELFGALTIEDEAAEVAAAASEVRDVVDALNAQTALLVPLAAAYGVAAQGSDVARRILEAAARR